MKTGIKILFFAVLTLNLNNVAYSQSWMVFNSSNSGIAGNWILSLEKEDNGVYWIGTLSGLSKFNFHTWQNFYTTNSPLGRNEIHDIAIDPVTKQKWFSVPFARSGTLVTLGGVYGYNDTNWTVFNFNNSPFINYKNYGIEIDSDRNLWISFSSYSSGPGGSVVPGGVVKRSVNGSWSHFTTNSGLSWYVNEEFKADSNGIVYILQYGGPATSGIDVYKNGVGFIGSYTPQNSGLPSQNVRRVDFDRNNNIWIAGWGITKYDRVNSWTHHTQSNSPLLSDIARDVAIDSNNNIWIGTLAGLSKIDINNNWTNYTTSNSPLPNNIIEALMVDGNNNVWIGTRSGLVIYNDSPSKNLQLTTLLEGRYNEQSNSMIGDTVIVYLKNTFSPYSIVDSAKGFLNSSGIGSFNFLNAVNGISYYLVVKHRNSIETWSASGNSFISNSLTYNYTTSSSQAYGNNMIQKGTKFCIYSGDVNQDGSANVSDVIAIFNDATSFVTGSVITDVNGDNIVNSTDIIIAYNNSVNFVTVRNPIVGDSQSPGLINQRSF